MASEKITVDELRQRICIFDRIVGKDSAGFDEEERTEIVRECWAKFARVSGSAVLRDGADFSVVKARFLIRATTALTDWQDRNLYVRYRGQDWHVLLVNEYGDRHEWTEIVCEQAVRPAAPVPPAPETEGGGGGDD